MFFSGGDKMSRVDTFTFRINDEERRLLAGLATRLERSQSDVIRWLLRAAAAQLNAQSRPAPGNGDGGCAQIASNLQARGNERGNGNAGERALAQEVVHA